MVEHCTNKQIGAYENVNNIKKRIDADTIKNAEFSNKVYGFCAKKWAPDYAMQDHCLNKMSDNATIFQNMLTESDGQETKQEILVNCLEKWSPQIDMVVYCAKKQIEALQKINNQ